MQSQSGFQSALRTNIRFVNREVINSLTINNISLVTCFPADSLPAHDLRIGMIKEKCFHNVPNGFQARPA